MIDTKALRELAQKATPGPWLVETFTPELREICIKPEGAETKEIIGCLFRGKSTPVLSMDDADYIAAANPEVVLALLDEIDRLRADNVSTSKLLNDAIDLVEKKNSQLVRLRKIEAAARNLAKVKGRHNSEIAMNQLLESLK